MAGNWKWSWNPEGRVEHQTTVARLLPTSRCLLPTPSHKLSNQSDDNASDLHFTGVVPHWAHAGIGRS